MLRLELSDEDVERLRELCQEVLSELRMEIAATDRMDFRNQLKQEKEFLERLIARLELRPIAT